MDKILCRKGQGAMEYLMTYGWAILVVMIVGIVLWQLGVFGGRDTPVSATGFSKVKPQLAVTGLTEDGVFTGVFTNAVGKHIALTGVRIINMEDGSLLCCSHQGIPNCATSDAASDIGGHDYTHFNGGGTARIDAGGNIQVELGGPGSASDCKIAGLEEGDDYNIKVDILFDLSLSGKILSYTTSGILKGPLE